MWLKPGMKVELPDQQGQSISMIGALSINKGLLHISVFAGSNTADTFLPFLLWLKEKWRDRPTIVVMDNLQVHKSKFIQGHFDDHTFKARYLPPQSCTLNPIEHVWNLVKARWRRTSYLILDQAKKTDQQIFAAIDMINEITNSLDHYMLLRIARSNYSTMAQSMRGYIV